MKFITNANISVWIEICRGFYWFDLHSASSLFSMRPIWYFSPFPLLFFVSCSAMKRNGHKQVNWQAKKWHTTASRREEEKNEQMNDYDSETWITSMTINWATKINRGTENNEKKTHHNQFVAVRQMVCCRISVQLCRSVRCNWCCHWMWNNQFS